MMRTVDLRNYGDAFALLVAGVVVDGEVERCRAPEGRHRQDILDVRTADLV
jgi:hypothetical protein